MLRVQAPHLQVRRRKGGTLWIRRTSTPPRIGPNFLVPVPGRCPARLDRIPALAFHPPAPQLPVVRPPARPPGVQLRHRDGEEQRPDQGPRRSRPGPYNVTVPQPAGKPSAQSVPSAGIEQENPRDLVPPLPAGPEAAVAIRGAAAFRAAFSPDRPGRAGSGHLPVSKGPWAREFLAQPTQAGGSGTALDAKVSPRRRAREAAYAEFTKRRNQGCAQLELRHG